MHDEDQNGKETPVQLQAEQVSSVDRRNEGTIPLKTITLSIAGMTCANCVAHVEGGLRSVHGVINVNVILATEHATVEITPGAVTIADLKHAVKDAGYEVVDVFDSGEA
jgi:copper chaperone CopZ